MLVALTGGTGFLGGALAGRLVAEGMSVRGLHRVGSVLPASLPVAWHVGDLLQPNTLPAFLDGADWVVHCAGILGEAGISDTTYHQINVIALQNLLQAVEKMAVSPKRILILSSAGVLGPLKSGERAEDGTEASPMAPSNPYERSKADAERLAGQFAKAGLPIVICRPEFVYGVGDTHVLGLFRAIQKGYFFYIGNGENSCHPTYIDDAVAGMWLCLTRGQVGETYQITGSRPVTFRELAESIAEAVDSNPPRWQMPVWLAKILATGLEWGGKIAGIPVPLSRTGVAFFSENRGFNFQKAHEQLGYSPQIELAEGVKRTVDWYRKIGAL